MNDMPQEYGDINILKPSGRLGRIRYIFYSFGFGIIFLIALKIAFNIVASTVPPESLSEAITFTTLIAYIPAVLIPILLGIQRLHDMNRSGFFILLMLIPILNIFMIIFLWVKSGSKGSNRFGLKPPPNTRSVKILAFVFMILFLLGGRLVAGMSIPAYQDYIERAQEAVQGKTLAPQL